MTIYKTHLHSALLSPGKAGLSPLPLEMTGDALYADGAGPLITVAEPRLASDPEQGLSGLKSYYAAVRPDADNTVTLPGYDMYISGSHLTFPATPTNLNEIFVLGPSPVGKKNPLPTIRPGPRQKLLSGPNVIVAADAPIEKLPAEEVVQAVEQSLGTDHPDFSRAVALRMMQNQRDIGRILVAVVDVAARNRRQALADVSRKIGASIAAIVALKALKESGPNTLAAVAAITTVGVGAAVTATLVRLARLQRPPAQEDAEPNTLALTLPTTQIPAQRPPTKDEQGQLLPVLGAAQATPEGASPV